MLNVFSTSQPFKSNFEYGMMDPAIFSCEKQSSRTDICVCLYWAIFLEQFSIVVKKDTCTDVFMGLY